MHVEFADKELERLYTEQKSRKYAFEIIKGFVRKIELIKAFSTEYDFKDYASLGYEKLFNYSKGSHSIRINDQWRIIFNIKKEQITIVEITELSKHYK